MPSSAVERPSDSSMDSANLIPMPSSAEYVGNDFRVNKRTILFQSHDARVEDNNLRSSWHDRTEYNGEMQLESWTISFFFLFFCWCSGADSIGDFKK